MRRHRRLLMVGLLVVACFTLLIVRQRRLEHRQDELEHIVAQMPTGISAAEAEQRIGRPPDRTTQQAGVIINPVMMYTASNSLAADNGKPQIYDCRLWYCGSLTVSVCTDDRGRVTFRTTTRPPRRASLFRRLKQVFQRLP